MHHVFQACSSHLHHLNKWDLNMDIKTTHARNSMRCEVCVCAHVWTKVMSKDKTNGIHPCLIRRQWRRNSASLQRINKSKRHINDTRKCQVACCHSVTYVYAHFRLHILTEVTLRKTFRSENKSFTFKRAGVGHLLIRHCFLQHIPP